MDAGIETPFRVTDDGLLMMRQRLYVPNNKMVKQKVLQEAYESKFAKTTLLVAQHEKRD
jgi:hypothetical protein